MAYSISRLTMFAVLTSLEEDLRSCIALYLGSSQPKTVLPELLYTKVLARARSEEGPGLAPTTVEELIQYLDFADAYSVLNSNRASLDEMVRGHLREITPQLDRLVPVRNRLMHSRPFTYDDYSLTLDLAQALADSGNLMWGGVRSTLVRLKTEPSFVATLTIPAPDWDPRRDRHNLPLPDFDDSGFIGRERQVEHIKRLCLGSWPVITIVGEGGLGKTAIALKVAYDILDSPDSPFDAIVWASSKTQVLTPHMIKNLNSSIRDSLGLLREIASQLSGKEVEDPIKEVQEYLESFRILIILDNLETVLDHQIRSFLELLPDGSKVLITSRIGLGSPEHAVKLNPMDRAESVQFLRVLAKLRDISFLLRQKDSVLRGYCERMQDNPGWMKWFVSSIQTGKRPEEILANPGMFLEFCLSNVYNYLSSSARTVIDCMLWLPGEHTQAELAFLSEFSAITLQQHLQELLRTNMVVMSSAPRGRSFESRYDLSELARNYLVKYHPVSPVRAAGLSKRKQQLIATTEQLSTDQRSNPYSLYSLKTYSRSDYVIARHLYEALIHIKHREFLLAEEKIASAQHLAPAYFEVCRVKAWLMSEQNNFPAARQAYEAALEIESEYAPLRVFYADFLMCDLGDLDEAQQQLLEARRLDPGSFDVNFLFARALLYSKEFELAREVIDKLLIREDLTEWNMRRTYDLHLQYFARLASHLCGRQEYSSAYDAIVKLKAGYCDCPKNVLDREMTARVSRSASDCRLIARDSPDETMRQQARDLAAWFTNEGTKVPSFESVDPTRQSGQIFNILPSYGFIECRRNRRIFFHRSGLMDPAEWPKLAVGVEVEFAFSKDASGREQATGVRIRRSMGASLRPSTDGRPS